MNNTFFIIVLIIIICSAGAGAQICFKSAIGKLNAPTSTIKKMFQLGWRLLFMPKVWLGLGLCYVVLALWLIVLSHAELNFAFSLSSLNYIFIALTSQFILKEKIGIQQWSATLLIAVGVFIVSLTGG